MFSTKLGYLNIPSLIGGSVWRDLGYTVLLEKVSLEVGLEGKKPHVLLVFSLCSGL